jgi:glycine betaine/proline transport system ATP-binding protein
MEKPEAGRSHKDLLAEAPATVSADTPIAELFTPCSTSGVAVAVTDADGDVIGVVPRNRLLAALGEDPQVENVLPAQRVAKKVNAGA